VFITTVFATVCVVANVFATVRIVAVGVVCVVGVVVCVVGVVFNVFAIVRIVAIGIVCIVGVVVCIVRVGVAFLKVTVMCNIMFATVCVVCAVIFQLVTVPAFDIIVDIATTRVRKVQRRGSELRDKESLMEDTRRDIQKNRESNIP